MSQAVGMPPQKSNAVYVTGVKMFLYRTLRCDIFSERSHKQITCCESIRLIFASFSAYSLFLSFVELHKQETARFKTFLQSCD